MAETFNYDVFISHSAKDKSAVRELAERLRKDGLRVWLDDWEIKPGDLILLKIEQGLEQSRTLVLAAICGQKVYAAPVKFDQKEIALCRRSHSSKF